MALLGDTTVFIQLLALQNCQEPDGLCWATGLGNTEGCFSNLGRGHYNAEQRERRYSGTTSAQISSPLPIIFLAFTSIHYVLKSSPARLSTPEFRHSVFSSSVFFRFPTSCVQEVFNSCLSSFSLSRFPTLIWTQRNERLQVSTRGSQGSLLRMRQPRPSKNCCSVTPPSPSPSSVPAAATGLPLTLCQTTTG